MATDPMLIIGGVVLTVAAFTGAAIAILRGRARRPMP